MRIPISEHYKDQLLDTLTYHMDQETRAILMREVPEAYNALAGLSSRPPVKVVRTSDGSEIK